MSNINDGGPAFPCPVEFDLNNQLVSHGSFGMSLRDYFAGQALMGEFVQSEYTGTFSDKASDDLLLARARVLWRMADAMIATREVKP
jgi:hypothetical protein